MSALQVVLPPDAIEERMDDDPCLIKVNDAIRACNIVFGSTKLSAVQLCISNIKGNSHKQANRIDRMVALDIAFDLIMRCWYGLGN